MDNGRLFWYTFLFIVFTAALILTIKNWETDLKHIALAAVEVIMMIDSARAFIIQIRKKK
ncbi:MAG: hypothetical protein MJZ16_04735 [Bacteroidales bacterium]|nr:hypothetical protein [Bacteroidales bacterium]